MLSTNFYPRTTIFLCKNSMQRFAGYGKWSIVELPLLPKVAFAHKSLRKALSDCENEISQQYFERIRNILAEIRKVNWNSYNIQGINYNETQQPRELLQKLKDCEQDLPAPLKRKIENVRIFSSVQDAIDCLDARSGNLNFKERPFLN